MTTVESPIHGSSSASHALQVLETFSTAAQISFDRSVAGRVLSEAEHAIEGNDARTWSRRLVEVGESLNLRVLSAECDFSDMLSFVQQRIPVAVCLEGSDGRLQWFIMTETKRRKIRVTSLNTGTGEIWVSMRRLKRMLGITSRSSTVRCIVGQIALACQSSGRSRNGGAYGDDKKPQKPLPPLTRLLGLLRPEKKDLWVVIVFSVVVGVLALATPIAVEALVNTVAFGRYLQPVVVLALLLFTFLAFAAAMRALITFVVEIIQRRLFIRVIEDLAYRLPRVRQEDLDNAHGPELVNRFFDVVTVQKIASSLMLDGISIVLQTAIGMIVLAFYHPFLLGFDVALLALIGFIVFVLGRGAVKTAIYESKAKYAVAAWLEELSRHPTAFKFNSGSQFALERADSLAVTWLERRRNHFRVVIRQILFALGSQAVAATVLLGLGGWLVILGELTLGQLVAAELIVMMIVGSFAKLGKHMEGFYDLLASVDKLGTLFDLHTESHDKLFHLRDGEAAEVRVQDVQYAYNGKPTLKNISLELRAGESVALAGPAGSGKSTVIDLLSGLRTPSSGHIELDGIDIRELRPDSLREHLAVAGDIEIFHGTIDENVHLNRPNIRTSHVRDALAAMGLLDELLKLPEGLNTVLQTGGSPLSRSQAIRLMVARAIVGRPRLLLIDGTLDALPDDMLRPVLATVIAPNNPWTLLITTGRKSIMDYCERVVKMSDGDSPSESKERINLKR